MAEIKKPDPYEPCVPDYRGVPVDPRTGRPIDPFRCRDPKNVKRTNPRRKDTLDPDAGERFWGID